MTPKSDPWWYATSIVLVILCGAVGVWYGPAMFPDIPLWRSLLGGVLILDYGYWAAFGLACLSRIASGLIMAIFFGFKPAKY